VEDSILDSAHVQRKELKEHTNRGICSFGEVVIHISLGGFRSLFSNQTSTMIIVNHNE